MWEKLLKLVGWAAKMGASAKPPVPVLPVRTDGEHRVFASSFADPADVAAYWRCKESGGTDQQCYRVGDNGVGCWGDDTTRPAPMCALPPEDWRALGRLARGARVLVTVGELWVVCELRDTMPHRANITNGCGIDLNPAALKSLGKSPPAKFPVVWKWL